MLSDSISQNLSRKYRKLAATIIYWFQNYLNYSHHLEMVKSCFRPTSYEQADIQSNPVLLNSCDAKHSNSTTLKLHGCYRRSVMQ